MTFPCSYCGREFESAELEVYAQTGKDMDWPLPLEDIARFVCSMVCGNLFEEREESQ